MNATDVRLMCPSLTRVRTSCARGSDEYVPDTIRFPVFSSIHGTPDPTVDATDMPWSCRR
jgi:hypothetical protein